MSWFIEPLTRPQLGDLWRCRSAQSPVRTRAQSCGPLGPKVDDFGGMVRDGKRDREGEENMRKQGRCWGVWGRVGCKFRVPRSCLQLCSWELVMRTLGLPTYRDTHFWFRHCVFLNFERHYSDRLAPIILRLHGTAQLSLVHGSLHWCKIIEGVTKNYMNAQKTGTGVYYSRILKKHK